MVKVLLRREITRQAMVFVLIGLTSTVLNYLIFLIFFAIFSINYLLSAGIGFMAGVVFGFGFNKTLTF
ncbi:MAG: GtrA family protein, partial [Nanoarchaeota archaeon]